jgi:hypothetical protein
MLAPVIIFLTCSTDIKGFFAKLSGTTRSKLALYPDVVTAKGEEPKTERM